VAGRFGAMLIQPYGDFNAQLMIVAITSEFIGCILLISATSQSVVLLVAAFAGFGFGTVGAAFPVLAAVHFPGGIASFPKNFGIILSAVLLGNLVFIGVTDGVFAGTNANDPVALSNVTVDMDGCTLVGPNYIGNACYRGVFTAFAIIAAMGLMIATAVYILIRRKAR